MRGESMSCCDVPIAVFVETNLGTRLAVPTSSGITAEDFKREVEKMHLNCFPELRNIRVNALMVKQKSHCYHLSESLPLKYAFLGSNATWFLQTRVNLSNTPNRVESLKHNEAEVHNLNSFDNTIADSVETGGFAMPSKRKRKKVKVQRFPTLKASMPKLFAASCFIRKRRRKKVRRKRVIGKPRRGPIQCTLTEKETLSQSAPGDEVNGSKKPETNVDAEAIGETVSEPASVSGLIKKYFSDYDEVASSPAFVPTRVQHGHKKQLRLTVQSRNVWPEKPSSKHKKPDIGKRLLLASNTLGLTPSHQRSVLSLCRNLV